MIIVDARSDDMRLGLKGLKDNGGALGIVVGQGGRNVGPGNACQTMKMVDNIVA